MMGQKHVKKVIPKKPETTGNNQPISAADAACIPAQ